MTHREFTWFFPPNEDGTESEQEPEQDDTYNGWSNWDTWNAHLWATNDYETYRYIVDSLAGFDNLQDMAQAKLAGDIISGALRNCLPLSDARRKGKAWDGIDFDAVDWKAIVTSFQEDLEN